MQINRINSVNYNPQVSFGEAEGISYQDRTDAFPPRSRYELKKKQINDKFDLKRDLLRKTAWESKSYEVQADQIEMSRRIALEELDKTCTKCLSGAKKWNPLRLLGLIK